MTISLTEYAKANNRNPATARQMALRGSFETARKFGRNWVIEDTEPWPDHRVKTGKYKNWRKPKDTDIGGEASEVH